MTEKEMQEQKRVILREALNAFCILRFAADGQGVLSKKELAALVQTDIQILLYTKLLPDKRGQLSIVERLR